MKIAFLLAGLLLCGNVAAAGGSSMGGSGGGMSTPPVRLSPEQLAIQNYNKGIGQRDKAWDFENRAKSEPNDKKRQKLLKKANKAYLKAVKRLRTAVKHNPRLYQAHSSLGYALRKTGNYDASLEAYDNALVINPNYAEAIEYRAEANLALGNLADTRRAYIKLMQIDQKRAAQLMQAIDIWLQAPPTALSEDEVESFRAWSEERQKLGHFIDDTGPSTTWGGH